MDAMFYIQASTKQQASFIFDFLATRLYAHCQLIEPLNETIIPSLSRTTLSLQPGPRTPRPGRGDADGYARSDTLRGSDGGALPPDRRLLR